MMDELLNQILLRMLEEHLGGEVLDAKDWTERYPRYSREITEYLTRLQALPSAFDTAASSENDDPAAVAHSQALARRAMARGNLQRKDRSLGAMSERIRSIGATVPPQSDQSWFPKIAVYGWIVVLLHEENGYCKRFRAQKVAYLTEQALAAGLFTSHARHAAGPYDSALRYEEEGEPYAVKQRWFDVEEETDEDPERRSGLYHLAEFYWSAATHASRFLKDPAATEELIRHLAKASNDELETMATVADLAQELLKSGRTVTTESVLATLRVTKEYQKKQGYDYFSPDAVRDALIRLRDLQIVVGIPDPEDEL
jgi:hypothetical protein